MGPNREMGGVSRSAARAALEDGPGGPATAARDDRPHGATRKRPETKERTRLTGAFAALFVQAAEKVFEFGQLFGRKNGANLVSAALAGLLNEGIGLLVDLPVLRFHIGENRIELLLLLGAELDFLREMLNFLLMCGRCMRTGGVALVRGKVANHSAEGG